MGEEKKDPYDVFVEGMKECLELSCGGVPVDRSKYEVSISFSPFFLPDEFIAKRKKDQEEAAAASNTSKDVTKSPAETAYRTRRKTKRSAVDPSPGKNDPPAAKSVPSSSTTNHPDPVPTNNYDPEPVPTTSTSTPRTPTGTRRSQTSTPRTSTRIRQTTEVTYSDLSKLGVEDWDEAPEEIKQKGLANKKKGYYKVENILDQKIQHGERYFLIKWDQWSHEFNTWEHEEDVSAPAMIARFLESRKRKITETNMKSKADPHGKSPQPSTSQKQA